MRTSSLGLVWLVAVGMSGCGLSTNAVSFGFGDAGSSTASIAQPPSSTSLLGEPVTRQAATSPKATRLAERDDQAPAGSFESGQRGALADRNYSTTALDPAQARQLINAYRKQHGLKPLTLNAELSDAAKSHSRDLAKWDRISHFGSDGSNPWDRVKRTGYQPRIAAENVGTGQVSFAEVLKGWQESDGHNKNLLLPDVDHMGIALVQDPKTEFKSFWTLVVARTM